MVEIALCIAIIGFALVAIIGVLPTAMRVQQDNRGDTLIDQDGNYWMEAIRHGAIGVEDLTNYVYCVNFIEVTVDQNGIVTDTRTNTIYTNNLSIPMPQPAPLPPAQIIGALSAPLGYSRANDGYFLVRTEARVRAISGAAVEKDPQVPISFDYLLTSEVSTFNGFDETTSPTAFGAASTNDIPLIAKDLRKSLHEMRLTFRWPLTPASISSSNYKNKKVYRNLVSGSLVQAAPDYFFFQPETFTP
jgi:hypothetical protein